MLWSTLSCKFISDTSNIESDIIRFTAYKRKPIHGAMYCVYRRVLKTRRDAKFLIRLVSAEPSIMNVSNSLYANKYIVGLPMLHHDGDGGGGESVDVVIVAT